MSASLASAAMSAPVDTAAELVTHLAHFVAPLCGTGSVAAAIVMLTMCVRVVLIPLSYAQARADVARRALAPRIAELRRRHERRRNPDPARLQRELLDLYRGAGVSPLAGCLPALAPLPVFFVLYRLFSTDGDLLAHELGGASLAAHPLVSLAGPGTLVFVVVILTAAVAAYAHQRHAATTTPAASADSFAAPMAKVARWMPFATVVTAAVVPLAAGLYLVVGSIWAAAERPLLRRLATHRAGGGAIATP